jgi:hypothetical protein
MYDYAKEREHIFTEQGQRLFLEIRDRVQRLIAASGAVTMGKAIRRFYGRFLGNARMR